MTFGRLSLFGLERLLLPFLALVAALAVAREAVIAPKIAVGLVFGLVLVAISIWRLIAGVAIFVVLTFPEHLPGSLGVGQTLAKPVGLVLILSWLLSLASQRERVPLLFRDQPLVAACVLAFTVWAIASLVWATDTGAARFDASRLVQVVVLMFVTYSATRTTRDLSILMWSFLVGAVASSLYSLGSGSYGEGGRLSGIFDPNYFAAELVAAMLFAAFMLAVPRRPFTRLILLVFLGIYAAAFVLTESRGGIIALAAAFLATVFLAGPIRARAIAVLLIVSAIAIVYYAEIAPAKLRDRITNVSAQSSAGRADEWRIALRIVGDHPLLGVGIGNYRVVEPSYAARNINLLRVDYAVRYRLETHSTYLNLLSELGVVGLGLFLALLGLVLKVAMRGIRGLARVGDLEGELLARGLMCGSIGLLAAYFFLSAQAEKQLWLLLGMLATIPTIVREGMREAED
jgi:O-antigen ligase